VNGVTGTPILGFDNQGQVFDFGNAIVRKVFETEKATVSDVYRIYLQEELCRKGIVETTMLDNGDLEHKRLTISYPFEWPANMYKDALLFHLRLFANLANVGLTLKDALPNNILFEHTTPVFVDFLSLVRTERLNQQVWLGPQKYIDPRFAVVEKMLLPYMALPLIFMARREYQTARDLLSWRSCNCNGPAPSWRELLQPNRRAGMRWVSEYFQSLAVAARFLPIRRSSVKKWPSEFEGVVKKIGRIADGLNVTPPLSAYSSYYDEKKEAQSLRETSSFLPKQRAVLEILEAHRPASLLDIGANTGWYSHLAAKNGASVIALEQDESCIDILYRRCRTDQSRILPLRLSFSDLQKEIHSSEELRSEGAVRNADVPPLYRAATERLASDMVLALGLFHHLVLGEGRAIGDVIALLAKLARKILVLEFITLNDEKIVNEPSFFPNLERFDVESYCLEKVTETGGRFFSSFYIWDSHPETRKILVFEK
jgi:hypothetical protein